MLTGGMALFLFTRCSSLTAVNEMGTGRRYRVTRASRWKCTTPLIVFI